MGLLITRKLSLTDFLVQHADLWYWVALEGWLLASEAGHVAIDISQAKIVANAAVATHMSRQLAVASIWLIARCFQTKVCRLRWNGTLR